MPVEIEISCTFPEPGWQSRLIETSIWVSLVFRSICAVRAAIMRPKYEKRQMIVLFQVGGRQKGVAVRKT